MSTQPVENLELRALEQRRELHQTASELKEKIADVREKVREKFDLSRNLHEHFFAVAMAVGIATTLLSVAIGYRFKR